MFYGYPVFLLLDEAEFYGPTYIQYCEYLQLDPRINYSLEQFNQRYSEILEKFKINPGRLTLKDLQQIEKGLKWIQKRNNNLPLIVNYTSKLILQKKLIIPEGMIQKEFNTSIGLTKYAIQPYNRYVRNLLLGFFIFLIIILFGLFILL